MQHALATTCGGPSDDPSPELPEELAGAGMPPGLLNRALLVVCCGALSVGASACESTEDESAKLGREGTAAASTGTLKLGAANHSVRILSKTLLEGGGRKAVVLRLSTTSAKAQREVPLLVSLTAAGGKLEYTNASAGLEAPLQHVAVLRPHGSVWWVDDQVLTAHPAPELKVSLGTGSAAAARETGSDVEAAHARLSEQGGTSTLSGVLVNRSGKTVPNAVVSAVATRAGKPVAAGRAVVASLPAHKGASAPFQIFFVGDPKGAKLDLSPVGSAAAGGQP